MSICTAPQLAPVRKMGSLSVLDTYQGWQTSLFRLGEHLC